MNTLDTTRIDRLSFQLGMINCFVEMVAFGVKKLALSPPLTPQEYEQIKPWSERLISEFNINAFLEKDFIVTDLSPPEFTRGKWVILYYRSDGVLSNYMRLKSDSEMIQQTQGLQEKRTRELSRQFMRLLSYPEPIIEDKLAGKLADPFVVLD